jgi:hypothetical protein
MADVAFVDVGDDLEEFREDELEVLRGEGRTFSSERGIWARLGLGKCSMTR